MLLHPEFGYDLVDTGDRLLVLASERRDACLASWGLTGSVVATTVGAKLGLLRFRHPFYDRDALGEPVRVSTDVLLRVLACGIGDDAFFDARHGQTSWPFLRSGWGRAPGRPCLTTARLPAWGSM